MNAPMIKRNKNVFLSITCGQNIFKKQLDLNLKMKSIAILKNAYFCINI